jgi:uncharacterized protein
LSAQTFPDRNRRAVVDTANIIPDDQELTLNNKIADWNKQTGNQFVILTLNSLNGQDIKDYSYKLGRNWGLGKGKLRSESTGVILVYVLKDKKARIEVGPGLQGVLTDAATSDIIRNVIIAKSKQGDALGAITGASDAIMTTLTPAPEPVAATPAAVQTPPEHGFRWGLFFILMLIVFVPAGVLLWAHLAMKKQSRKEEEWLAQRRADDQYKQTQREYYARHPQENQPFKPRVAYTPAPAQRTRHYETPTPSPSYGSSGPDLSDIAAAAAIGSMFSNNDDDTRRQSSSDDNSSGSSNLFSGFDGGGGTFDGGGADGSWD